MNTEKELHNELTLALQRYEQQKESFQAFFQSIQEEERKHLLYILKNQYDLQFSKSIEAVVQSCKLGLNVLKSFKVLKDGEGDFIRTVIHNIKQHELVCKAFMMLCNTQKSR